MSNLDTSTETSWSMSLWRVAVCSPSSLVNFLSKSSPFPTEDMEIWFEIRDLLCNVCYVGQESRVSLGTRRWVQYMRVVMADCTSTAIHASRHVSSWPFTVYACLHSLLIYHQWAAPLIGYILSKISYETCWGSELECAPYMVGSICYSHLSPFPKHLLRYPKFLPDRYNF